MADTLEKINCSSQNESNENLTSGNIIIDEFIKNTQLNSNDYFIKWIPYSNLKNIEFLTSGGNSDIYSGTWNSVKIILKVINSEDINYIINEVRREK